jgi:hypothetical protein
MKPFDPTKPYQQRNGMPAEILCDDLDGDGYTIAARISRSATVEAVYVYPPCGRVNGASGPDSQHDLVNIPEKKTGWVLIYRDVPNNRRIAGAHIYLTEQGAKEALAGSGAADIGCVTWEE